MSKNKPFKTLNIDFEKRIFELNGDPMDDVYEFSLNFDGEWTLLVKRLYKEASTPDYQVRRFTGKPPVVEVKFQLACHDWCKLQDQPEWHQMEECIVRLQREHNR